MNAALCSSHHPARSSLALVLAPIQYGKMATNTCQRSYLGQLLRACPLVQLSLRINKNCGQLVSLDCGPNLDVMEDQPKTVRVRWTGNKSRYDNKVEDVPAHCILEEDRPASVGRSVRVQLDQGGRIWKGVVEDLLSPPSALELALPANRAKVRYTVLVRTYMCTCIFCKCVLNVRRGYGCTCVAFL